MNLKKDEIISSILNKLYPEIDSFIYHTNTYIFLIAVILSANTKDQYVNKCMKNLTKIIDSPETMLKTSKEKIKELIKSCGCSNRKTDFLIKTSKMILNKFNGKIPTEIDQLMLLPGVGRKTALVMLSQKFNMYAFPVDTHIKRCSIRWGIANKNDSILETEKKLEIFFHNKKQWKKLHLQIIKIGREYCKARSHNALLCPICSVINVKNLK